MIDRHIYLEPGLDEVVVKLAKEEHRSVAAQIRVLLREALGARQLTRQKESVHD